LGAAVVKAACKVCLKDQVFVGDASVEVIDVIKVKVGGELDQRLARRLFEDLEVLVSANLSVLRQREFGGMPAVLTIAPLLRTRSPEVH
jgi:hypothetical protein